MKPFPPIVAHCWTQKPSQGAILSNSHAISFKKTHQVLPGLSFCGAICAKGAECWRLGKVHVSQAFSQKVFLTPWCLKRQARGASFFPPFLQVEIASLILVVSWVYWLFLEILIILYICDTSSTAQGGGGSFKNRKRIGEIDCCEWRMSEQKHWPTD